MSFLQSLGKLVRDTVTQTPKHLSAFVFLVFALGEVVGMVVASHRPDLLVAALLVPVALAFMSFYSNTIAVLFFLLFVVLIFLV
jgi:hypothetical protein